MKALIFGALAVASLLAAGLLSGCAAGGNIHGSSIPEIQAALDAGVPVDTRESNPNSKLKCYDGTERMRDFTPLIKAALEAPSIVPYLLARGADVKMTDGCGNSALHFAAGTRTHNGLLMKDRCADGECLVLLEHGADPRSRAPGGHSDFYAVSKALENRPDPALLAALTKAMGGEAALRAAMAAESGEAAPAADGAPPQAPAAGAAKPWWESGSR